MSDQIVSPVLAVDKPYKNASHTKPTSSAMSKVIVMMASTQGAGQGVTQTATAKGG